MNQASPRVLRPNKRCLLGVAFALLFSAASLAASLPGHAEPAGRGAGADRKWKARDALLGRQELPAFAERYDLIVYGATPGGVACAVRAARQGLSVLLVEHSLRVGGMFSSGLSVMDTLYAGARAPLYDEVRRAIHDHYRITYGPDSPQFVASRPGHPKTYFEAHVAEAIIADMIVQEPSITLVRGFYPARATVESGRVRQVAFLEKHATRSFTATGAIFADCSYEADLAVAAGAQYRVGRESRDEFKEEHAGRIFLRKSPVWPPPGVDPKVITKYKTLNLFHYDRWFEIVRPESTGAGDKQIQTYNIRAVLTTNPENRYIPTGPPPDYDADVCHEIWSNKPPYSQLLGPLPNQKYLWNMPEVIGPQNDYPEGDWKVRERVVELHRRATAGMLYFLQNDPRLSPEVHTQWKQLGFARDEFQESGHLPMEVYARETRRVKGRTTFTENDVRLTGSRERSPVHADSIGVTEWFVDSHASTTERVRDSIYEGEVYLNYISHPAQIPYSTILPEGFDNLLVPICLSATHVGWGAIRLEPTWMALGEAAAHAAVLSVERRIPPATVPVAQLIRRLAQHRILITFFNDVALEAAEAWVPAVQLLGTQGFFGSYDADPHGRLTAPTGEAWAEAAAEWVAGRPADLDARAQRLRAAEQVAGKTLTAAEFVDLLLRAAQQASVTVSTEALRGQVRLGGSQPITRGRACQLIVALRSERSD